MWDFNGSARNETVLKPLCLRVEEQFDLPPRRLYRYFATFDDPPLLADHPHLRGFHASYDRERVKQLPPYLAQCFRLSDDDIGKVPLDAPFEALIAFDDLIYVRHETCLDPTGCVITYAHELQHVIQQYHYPDLAEANSELYKNITKWKPDAAEADIPAEAEANIISKGKAEAVCGPEAVEKFAEHQIFLAKTGAPVSQMKKWEYFLNTPSTTVYDFVGNTLALVNEHKAQLDLPLATLLRIASMSALDPLRS